LLSEVKCKAVATLKPEPTQQSGQTTDKKVEIKTLLFMSTAALKG